MSFFFHFLMKVSILWVYFSWCWDFSRWCWASKERGYGWIPISTAAGKGKMDVILWKPCPKWPSPLSCRLSMSVSPSVCAVRPGCWSQPVAACVPVHACQTSTLLPHTASQGPDLGHNMESVLPVCFWWVMGTCQWCECPLTSTTFDN